VVFPDALRDVKLLALFDNVELATQIVSLPAFFAWKWLGLPSMI
jgi:hypothetical protein